MTIRISVWLLCAGLAWAQDGGQGPLTEREKMLLDRIEKLEQRR